MDEFDRITQRPGVMGGRPCIRGMRISVYDVLGWLAAGMSNREILDEYPELTLDDIHAALSFAADRQPPPMAPSRLVSVA